MNLKYQLFKVVNYGVYSTDNFKEKKILQIYNVFLFLVLINVLIIGVLLWFYSFHKQIISVVVSLAALAFSLYLNKKGRTSLSKIFIIQYFIICVLIVLCMFSFFTIFPLFFFLIILYCSLIFNNKERNIMLFLIIQCVVLLLISLTPLYKLLPNYNLLPTSEISNMNLICIIGFIFFLFTFIYFHTEYQRKLELKYLATNVRLLKRNETNLQNNNNNKKLLSIISLSLQQKLSEYKSLFEAYTDSLKNLPEQTDSRVKLFEKMNLKNKKIEELINFRFTNNREVLLKANFEKFKIQGKTRKIIAKEQIKNTLVTSNSDFEIFIHADLYTIFLTEMIKEKRSVYNPKKTYLNFKTSTQNEVSCLVDNCLNLFGINVCCFFNNQQEFLVIEIYFSTSPDNTAIYNV